MFYLVRAQELPFKFASALRLGMIGFYLNTFLPGAVGGDIIKAAFVAREQSRVTVAVATVIIDRVIGLCGLIWLTALAGGFFWLTGLLEVIATEPESILVLESIFLVAAGLMAGSVVFWLLLGCLANSRRRLDDTAQAIAQDRRPAGGAMAGGMALSLPRGAVAFALILSIVGHLGFVLVFYLSAREVNDAANVPSLQAHLLAVPVGMVIAAGIPTPGGVGGGEFVYGKLYQLLGYAVAAGVIASLVKRSRRLRQRTPRAGIACRRRIRRRRRRPAWECPPQSSCRPAPPRDVPGGTAHWRRH